MKQLSTYFEGLLNKSGKTSTDSSVAVACGEYIENNIKTFASNDQLTYSVHGTTILMNGNKEINYNITSTHIVDLVSNGIKKIILSGYWTIFIDSKLNLPISIECDQVLTIRNGTFMKSSQTIKNISIKADRINIKKPIKLSKSNIQARILNPYNISDIRSSNIEVDTILLELSQDKDLLNLIVYTYVAGIFSDSITHVNWYKREPHRVEEIRGINPAKVFGIDKYSIKNIVVDNSKPYGNRDVLVFTKDVGSLTLRYPETYEMAGGYRAVWVDDLKQFI